VKALADGVRAANSSEDIKNKVAESGSELSSIFLDDYKNFLAEDFKQWGAAVKASGFQIE
jgi:tripartite-type tricarboxylate transporter receptor subunit TctC